MGRFTSLRPPTKETGASHRCRCAPATAACCAEDAGAPRRSRAVCGVGRGPSHARQRMTFRQGLPRAVCSLLRPGSIPRIVGGSPGTCSPAEMIGAVLGCATLFQLTRSRRLFLRTALASVLLTTVFSAAVPAADAARATIRDARGDADPAWDIRRVVVNNGQRTLIVQVYYRAKLRLERPLGLLTSISLEVGYPENYFSATVVRGNETEGGDYVRGSKTCRGLVASVQINRRRVVFKVPQRCFGSSAGRVRFSRASTYQVRGLATEVDDVERASRWIERG